MRNDVGSAEMGEERVREEEERSMAEARISAKVRSIVCMCVYI
jgi:hypothetical protein